MKKYILVLICLIITTQAQAYYDGSCNQGWYGSGFGGVNFLDTDKEHGVKLDAEVGFLAGGAIGYKFCNDFRLEGELAYRRNSLDKVRVMGYRSKVSGHIATWSCMTNLLYDFDLEYSLITPYIGLGLGYAYDDVKVKNIRTKYDRSNFALQWILGANYPIAEKTDLSLEYRLFAAHSNVRSHGISLGLKRFF